MRSLTDYIMCSDRQIFQNVAVQDPRHNSVPLHGHGVSEFLPLRVISHITYVTGYASLFSVHTPDEETDEQSFCRVYARCPKAKQTGRHYNSWISESTWRIVYDRLHVTLVI